ncbi:hypothetical protein [Pedosphaera parvula]|uniref:DUF4157 domain-containing protein n=1 Tax=Pedosphaera parvula (strain Ellin514) TaxID=320771 RepID=B9XSU5_PEDPL|nr:hypothetical protein [Pedosphaera parvula]EEF57082.1 conserved hypothetical protein [Pedosphaera parvula Ellin514]
MITPTVIKVLLPLVVSWVEAQENIILREGVALTAPLVLDAKRIGIQHPEKVRLRVVRAIPLPANAVLHAMAQKLGFLSPFTAGLTLRYGIYIRADCWGDRRLVVHELAHVAQYERLGGIRPFLEQYLQECLTVGYPFGDLEQEAKRVEQELCG